MSKRVAVVLPAFNEALGLEKLLWRIARALDHLEYETVLVDDGSTDDTVRIAESLGDRLPIRVIRHEVNSGYGAAIRTGLVAARRTADVVVTMDADDSHDPALIPLMLHSIACGSDLIVASRFVSGGAEVGVPLYRRVLSHGARLVFSQLLRFQGVRDYTSGYRAYSSELLDRMIDRYGEASLVSEVGFTAGVELLLRAHWTGGRLGEVPLVLRYDRKWSESKLRLGRTMVDYVRLLRRIREEDGGREAPRARDPRAPRIGRAAAPLVVDAIAVVLAFALSFVGLQAASATGLLSAPASSAAFTLQGVLFAGITSVAFWRMGLHAPRLSIASFAHLRLVIEGLAVASAGYFSILLLSGAAIPSRVTVVLPVVAACALIILGRRWLGASSRWVRHRKSRALIYGATDTGRLLAKQMIAAGRSNREIVGFLDDYVTPGTLVRSKDSRIRLPDTDVRVLGSMGELAAVVSEHAVDELYVAVDELGESQLAEIREEAEGLGLELAIVPSLGVLTPNRVSLDDLGVLPVLRSRWYEPSPVYRGIKRILDIALVVLITPLAVPVALATALAVALDGRPILFRQTRIGHRGRPFTVLKFRTMHPNCHPYAESPDSGVDPRVTPAGRLIRMAGVDELPQLINVIRGEMSIVGPRPEMPQIAASYGALERQRLSVRPGITGPWQLSPDRAGAIHESIEHDLYYLRQQSLVLDVLLVLETALFACRAATRSLGEAARAAMVAWRKREPAPEVPAAEPGFVLLALDQRRRPTEPPSWSEFIPRAAGLVGECPVKVVVAELNEPRIRELSLARGGRPNGNGHHRAPRHSWPLEYVAYDGPDRLHHLARSASVVVTDLEFVADSVSTGGGVVVDVTDGDVRCLSRSDEVSSTGLVARVLHNFGGPDRGLRYAQ